MTSIKRSLTAAAGNAGESLYVEDVFSTYLFTPTGGVDTHVNGIDLDGEGGMVWQKNRSGIGGHIIYDTERGLGAGGGYLSSNNTNAESGSSAYFTSFNSNGFTTSADWPSSIDIASWTFRKTEKFFDVVTYTGNGVAGREIAHNLGSVPACMIIKNITTSGDLWMVYHKDSNATIPEKIALILNDTVAAGFDPNYLNSTTPTSSVFTLGGSIASNRSVNDSGENYVAYLFAHDAGGFGDDGSESIIKCGSFTGNTTVDLGFEPAWIMIKPTSTTGDWDMHDVMRGWPSSGDAQRLKANSAEAETSTSQIYPNATGFSTLIGSATYIYIAIRRPMKTPESGTEVYTNVEGSGADPAYVSGFVTDLGIRRYPAATQGNKFYSRLTGGTYLDSTSTAAQVTDANGKFDYMDAWFDNPDGSGYYGWSFKRATGFFDVVAYTGTGSLSGVNHNLGVTPELKIIKRRSGSADWVVGGSIIGEDAYAFLNSTAALTSSSNYWDGGNDSATVFSVRNTNIASDSSGQTYITYLFATLAGVSKVGSYTGTGADLNVDCGFSAGARFILIKRTDSTGDWYVWDSVRGIVAGNDPYLLLNSTAAEVTSTDYIDPLSSGFTVTSSAPAALNASGGTYIFLAIA